MNIADFVNALADDPESNIVHDVECPDSRSGRHAWYVVVHTAGTAEYEVTFERGRAVLKKVREEQDTAEMESVLCEQCGTDLWDYSPELHRRFLHAVAVQGKISR